jgi:hypothetical protein
MTFQKIDNHILEAQGRLVEQYKESNNFKTIIKAIVKPLQILEDEGYKVYSERWIDDAYGKQLDGLGSIVGELRLGRSDVIYREAIITRIGINISGGEPESIINTVRQLFNPNVIDYVDLYPANYQLYIQSDIFIREIRTIIDSLSPAGIGNVILIHGGGSNPFVFSEISTTEIGFDVQSGSFNGEEISELEIAFNELNTYNLDVVIETVLEDFTGEGFAEVILNISNLELDDGSNLMLDDGSILEIKLHNSNEDFSISQYGGELVEVI